MPSLIAYLRASSDGAVQSLKLPDAPAGQQSGQELCTLPDGRTIVALFDGYTLPTDQPAEIAASIETLTLTDALKERIKSASPIVALISERMIQKIRNTYTQEDETYFAHILIESLTYQGVLDPVESNAVTDYSAFIKSVQQWGRDELAKLGLWQSHDLPRRLTPVSRLRADAARIILDKYPLWVQANYANGVYPTADADAMKAAIASVIAESNRCEDILLAGGTPTPNWPII